MSEPVVYMLQDEDDVEFNTVDRFSCGRTGGIPLYLHPDPRVSELEAVLVEAREALVPYMKYVDGTKVLNHPAQVVAKIDEVLKHE